MLNAHGAALATNLFHGTFNVQIQSVDGTTTSTWVPPNDDTYRTAAYNAGVALGGGFATGADFLLKGNYVHPSVHVTTVNGTTITDGQLYYAGSDNSFSSPPTAGSIVRDSLEIMAVDDIESVTGSPSNGSTITVILDASKIFNRNVTGGDVIVEGGAGAVTG